LRLLLDTVALLFWWSESARLGRLASDAIIEGDAAIYVSAISVWEIANKNRIGKLDAVGDFQNDFGRLITRDGFMLLDLTPAHAMKAGYLRGDHRDPFDRLLAGQALVEDLTVLTNDPEIAAFGCKVLW
jgi:PIN domain nuclease of toxin-antitoxin system